MKVDTAQALKAASDKTKSQATGPAKKQTSSVPTWVYVGGGVLLILIVGVMIMAMSKKPSSQQVEQQNQQQFTDASESANASNGLAVYEQTEREIIQQPIEADYSKELVYFTDPSTGMKMVETPNGPLLVGSAEGTAYIQDYEAKRSQWLAANPPVDPNAAVQGEVATQEQDLLNQQLMAQQARIDSLEQQKVNMESELEQLSAYSDKQTQTITNLTNRVTQMQPVFDHANKQSQPKVQVSLTGKNRLVDVDAVSGDMAWISYQGKSVPVRVGDYLPGSNVKIKSIDGLHNKAILEK